MSAVIPFICPVCLSLCLSVCLSISSFSANINAYDMLLRHRVVVIFFLAAYIQTHSLGGSTDTASVYIIIVPATWSVVPGMVWSSAHQALKSVEAAMQDHVLGTGLNHLVSKQHLELRDRAFEFLHQQHASLTQAVPDDDASTPMPPYVPRCFCQTRSTVRSRSEGSRSGIY